MINVNETKEVSSIELKVIHMAISAVIVDNSFVLNSEVKMYANAYQLHLDKN